ncbi:hypothetical protein DY000_02015603 [Brassica cretica]|uniref:Arabidopsis retrotransposon Orf1 C-terminal domain-containing protein n=1 Tax=Brassica cretica TaxID=69181 RepID=A0ABQ7DA59_BRACR|nr:hypothetical protein DY000_02015603 [Brassica cretica]
MKIGKNGISPFSSYDGLRAGRKNLKPTLEGSPLSTEQDASTHQEKGGKDTKSYPRELSATSKPQCSAFLPRADKEGQLINLDNPMLLDFNCEGWDEESATRYNTLLNTEILPTRFGHADTLAALGLDTDVFETLQAMGIAPLCYQTHEIYPDLVRQVLATAHIRYENPSAPTYLNCSFSFMVDVKFCSLSLDKLNEIYETPDKRRETQTRSPRSNQPAHKLVATKRPSSGQTARSLCSDRALTEARTLRSDRARTRLGRYVATELSPKLGCYVATERVHVSVAT